MNNDKDLALSLAIHGGADAPVFRMPWEAEAFAMVVQLHVAGHFTWQEWGERLAAQISAATVRGDMDDGSRYYECWLAALEELVIDRQLVLKEEIKTRRQEWVTAIRNTPHGQPIQIMSHQRSQHD